MGKGLVEWRKERLLAAAEKAGGNAALGRLLKHQNGAQVGHMIAGRRPITEKTIEAIEAVPGYRGWFTQTAPSPPAGPLVERLREEQGLDPYELIERGLSALIVVGKAKDNVMNQIREYADIAAETQRAIDQQIKRKTGQKG